MTFGKYGIDAELPFGNRIDPNGIVETSSPKEIVSEIFISVSYTHLRAHET